MLTGNPGISKSWFQWKFILFCYHLYLFDKLSPFKEKILGGLKEDKPSLGGPTTEDQSSTEHAKGEDLNGGEYSLTGHRNEKQASNELKQVEQKSLRRLRNHLKNAELNTKHPLNKNKLYQLNRLFQN